MGGCFSSEEAGAQEFDAPVAKEGRTKQFARPKYKQNPPMTKAQLQKAREEFWDTQPAYGGDKNIWDALKAACEADFDTCKVIIESAGIIVAASDMTILYDERGAKYELPRYIVCDPTNLLPDPLPEPAQP